MRSTIHDKKEKAANVKENASAKVVNASKKYKVLTDFTMDGKVVHANQAIMLEDGHAKEFEGHVELIA